METIICPSLDGYPIPVQLWVPPNWAKTDRRGLLLLFFGGGWIGGSVKQFEEHAKVLSQRGMIVALPQYRTHNQNQTPVETAIEDAIASVSYFYDHGSDWGIDPNKIVLGGGSAGGHLAISTLLLSGLIPHYCNYQAHIKGLLLCNPVLDVPAIESQNQAVQASTYPATTLSPMHNLTGGLPDTIIFQGTADTTVSYETARDFVKASSLLGNHCTFIAYDGRNHGFFNCREGQMEDYCSVLEHMIAFLEKKQLLSDLI